MPQVGQLESRALLSDMTAPTTMATQSGVHGTNGWFVSPVTVNLSAADPDNTPAQITTFFSINGGPQQAGNSLRLVNDGLNVVTFHSQDPAGNVETTRTLLVMIDRTPPIVTINATPNVLWPPNHKLVPVTVSGFVFDATSGPAGAVGFQVIDEYGQVAPHGTVMLRPDDSYSFVVMLPASRLGQDHDGRTFQIFVAAPDRAGNIGLVQTIALVPHDMGHPFDFTPGGSPGFTPGGPVFVPPGGGGGGGGDFVPGGGGGGGGGKGHGGPKSHGPKSTPVSMPVFIVNPGADDGGGNGHGNGHANGGGNNKGHGKGHGHG